LRSQPHPLQSVPPKSYPKLAPLLMLLGARRNPFDKRAG
jgi:hypothetical protein